MRKNHPTCPLCSQRCIKHGKTSKGRPRWRCTNCGYTFTRPNHDATQAARFRIFMQWVTTNISLSTLAEQHGVSRRTLDHWFKPFWLIHPPTIADPYRIHPQIFIDGTYIGPSCLLIATNLNHTVSWFW